MTRSARFLAALVALPFIFAAAAADAQSTRLRFIGVQQFPAGSRGAGIGGLSGLDYDKASDRYIAISDDRSQIAPARFYEVDLALTSTSFSGVTFGPATTLLRPDGSTYPALGIDPEAIRFTGAGRIAYTSEGDAVAGQVPFVREANLDGSYVRDLAIPAYYNPGAGTGIRQNLAFESLTLSADGTQFVTATENALVQDGPASTLSTASPSRILYLDRATGAATAEFVYLNDPVAELGATPASFTVNGLTELLALDDTRFLALERSFSVGAPGTGYTIKLYEIDTAGASNVLGTGALDGVSYTPVAKTLLLDFATLGVQLDNVEAISFGEMLDTGQRSLIIAADDNFGTAQVTQFFAFAVSDVPEPTSWALMIGGFGLVGASLRRQRYAMQSA